MQQLELFAQTEFKIVNTDCKHENGFHTNAHAPGGTYCTDCHMVVIRDMPPAHNQPETLGYVSANWAWKYKQGKEWTNDYRH